MDAFGRRDTVMRRLGSSLLAKDNINDLFLFEKPKQNLDDGQLQLDFDTF
jgi:hypothetical protein